jgi:hypothetical protein
MRKFSIGIITGLFLAFSFTAKASSVTATQDGNWGTTDTWGGNAVPDGSPCYDTIIIPTGITVTITNTVDLTACPSTIVFVNGDLIFQNGKKLNLSNGSVVWVSATGYIDVGSGGGSSTYITIDGDQYWNAADGPFIGPGVLCQNCSLPIELFSFTAELIDGVVDLKWQTASEEENDYFIVQRSVDGFTWESIAVVDGAGNSSVLISYESEDRIPYLGLSYYRLKQVDMNGAFSFSETRVISNGQFYSDQEMLILSQTSGSQSTFVIYFEEPLNGTLNLYITAVNGAIIYSESRETASEEWVVVHLDQPLAAGMYVVAANQKIDKTFAQ